jgi:TonB family protein
MENVLIYFLKANIVLSIGFVFYKLLLANQRWFHLNRFLLIAIGLVALISPFLYLVSPFQNNTLFTINLPEYVLNQSSEKSIQTIDWLSFAAYGYLLISTLIVFRLLIQIAGLLKFNRGEKFGKYLIIESKQLETSSFFNRIFLKNTLDNSTREIAITHEKVHADQWHTLDVIWLELLTAIFWLNPAIWLLKKELRDTHEYIADEKTKAHFGGEDYLNAILNHAFNSQSINFITKFSNSQTLKNRITMMKSNHPVKRMRYLIFLPLLAVITIASANTRAMKVLPEVVHIEQTQVQSQDSTYTMVDQMPEFPGGTPALMEFLSKNIKYPESAKNEHIQGRVFISFIISDEGNVKDINILKGLHTDMDNEAVRVIRAMPKWKPGVHEGKNVNVLFNLPIHFKLSDKKEPQD